jgi:hypothetical protein
MNLKTAVGCACQCRDRCAKQGANRSDSRCYREDLQRGMARRARRWRAYSDVTLQMSVIEGKTLLFIEGYKGKSAANCCF